MRLIFLVLLVFLSGCVNNTSEGEFIIKEMGPQDRFGSDPEEPKPPKKEKDDYLIINTSYSYRPDGGQGSLRSLTNGRELHSGDYYTIKFTPEQECYVYIFQYDSREQLFTLFPPDKNYFKGEADWGNNQNPVKAKQTYFVPGEEKYFILNEHAGDETIHVLVSKEKQPELENEYKKLLESRKRGDDTAAQRAQNKMIDNIDKTQRARPKIGNDDGSEKQGITLQCDDSDSKYDCVNNLTFKHLQ